ncbi:MAG: pantetheine-phosphate adenylyltransferase [Candidatus Aureabacteria bacterium]|nr:pantetheine-phosphate adenylyltransferase [Candidatus Auribacterota bacterium]NLW95009.1 pantetheine-phosphate adenylyltransferase [Chlamydiota bacterium]HOE27826.1 pantetheine-phosphate adenylyltransferase [bacterium]HQM52204.1 pantetheine-phosphate adenylyltransferase [bacterium]
MTLAIYPGSFDPVTYGHIDVMERALRIFGRLVVAVAVSEGKSPLFSVEERLGMLREAAKEIPGVEVDSFDTLLVDYAKRRGAGVIIRGLRALSDFEYEFQMALTNRKIYNEIETIFLMPSEQYSYLSSRMIKEIAALGGDVRDFVSESVAAMLREKGGRKR